MILSLLLLAQAPLAVDAAGIGARLDGWKGSVKLGTGGAQCRTARSTGDAEIDRIACAALEMCQPQYESRYAASGDRTIRPQVKKMMRTALAADRDSCIASQRRVGVDALAAKRRVG